MIIKLNWLKIKNFKGIKDFMFNADGKNISVFGDNGKGKTTLKDSFLYLLFDKDSTDRTNFKIKPQDEYGNDIHNLNIEIEAELIIDGRPLKIKKMQEEKWTKKRGSETTELTGNTVSYWWDEVPVKAGEFKEKINDLINEDIFKKITNPSYFNKLPWQEKRKTLLEICGDMTDEQVIEADKSLLKLKEILNGRSIEDYKKVLADKLKGFKKEHDDIPPRIDELIHSLPQETTDYTKIENDIVELKKSLDGIEFLMLSQSKKTDEISKKYKELSSLKSQLEVLKMNIYTEHGVSRRKLVEKKAELESGKYVLESSIGILQQNAYNGKRVLENNSTERKKLLEQWKEYTETKACQAALQFKEPTEDNFICPTCKQNLPTETREAKLQELRDNFEKEKQSRIAWAENKLNENVTAGMKLKTDTEKLQKDIEENQDEILNKQTTLDGINAEISKIQEELQKPVIEPNYTENADYVALQTKINNMQIELDKPAEDKTAEILQRKSSIQTQIDEQNKILNGKAEIDKKKARIEELKAEEKRIANLIAELEGHKFLLEKFTISKVNLLEDKINSKFKYVKFKLFDVQMNGGIVETCEAMVNTNGSYVTFADANSAGQTNAGIDCINTISEFYDVVAPIWIDNRESIVKLIDTESQIISLVVSEKDKTLRIEREESVNGKESK